MFKRKIMLCISILLSMASNAAMAANNMEGLVAKVRQQVKKHPEVVAAHKVMMGAFYSADGMEKAIYNPELNTEIEREGSANNYVLGVSQRIDRLDKRGSRTEQADFSRIKAKEAYALVVQNKVAEAFITLIEYQSVSDRAELVLEQEKQMETLLDIIKKRAETGDLSQFDVEMAYLSLSQRLTETASVEAEKQRVEAHLNDVLPAWQSQDVVLPDDVFLGVELYELPLKVESHPAVIMAKAEWEIQQKQADLAAKNKKSDPTVGLNVGQINNENLVSMNFSIPLNLRNDFSDAYKAATEQALAAEYKFHQVKRHINRTQIGSKNAVAEYSMRFEKWQNLMQGRALRSQNILQKQWRLGDISTTEYLLNLEQRTAGLLSGIELGQGYKKAVIQWLLDTAQLDNNALTNKEISE